VRRLLPILCAVLAGCGSPLGTRIDSFPSDASSQGYRLLPRPILLPRGETSYDCGPESVAAVLQYWGKPVEVTTLSRQIVDPKLRSTVTVDIPPVVRPLGFSSSAQRGSMQLLKSSIDEGAPCIIAVKPHPTLGHFYVVSGYNDRLGGVVCEERDGSKTLIAYDALDEIWKRTEYVLLTIRPSNAAADYEAGAAYERVGEYEQAIALYRRALQDDPTFHEAHLGLGICHVGLGRLEEAAQEFELVLRVTPHDPKAGNNLAHVLAELGRDLERAERLAGQAVDAYSESKKKLETRVAAAADEYTRGARRRDLAERTLELAYACGTLGQVRFKLEKWDLAIAA
jgi:hypothetical protein